MSPAVTEPRDLKTITDEVVWLALAGRSRPAELAGIPPKVHALVSEAFEAGREVQRAESRASLAAAWTAWLQLLLGNRELVDDLRHCHPELWARLVTALTGEGTGA